MPDYSQTKIYKLVENNDLDHPIYIGHTTEKYLSTRMGKHRFDFNAWYVGSGQKYAWFREDITLKNISIVLIEDYPCENVGQARGRESYWKQYYKTKQNNPQPIFIGEGGFAENKDEWHKIYRELNKEKKQEYNKQYAEQNREKVHEHNKEYYELHKELIKKKQKENYSKKKQFSNKNPNKSNSSLDNINESTTIKTIE